MFDGTQYPKHKMNSINTMKAGSYFGHRALDKSLHKYGGKVTITFPILFAITFLLPQMRREDPRLGPHNDNNHTMRISI